MVTGDIMMRAVMLKARRCRGIFQGGDVVVVVAEIVLVQKYCEIIVCPIEMCMFCK